MPSEIWKAIAGFEGLYEVSDQGRVRSLARVVEITDGMAPRRRVSAKVLTPGVTQGYSFVTLFRDGVRRLRRVNVLVLEAFAGPSPSEKHQALHRDGVRSRNVIENLYWGTHTENMADRDRHGNTAKGERNGFVKITESDVLAIRANRTLSQDALAEKFGICQSQVSNIITRKQWAHI